MSSKDRHLSTRVHSIRSKIIMRGDLPYATVPQQLRYLNDLQTFPLGKDLIIKGCFDAFWTEYLMPDSVEDTENSSNVYTTEVEEFLMCFSPFINGWRESYSFYQKITNNRLRDHFILASIPCGLMKDVFALNYSQISDFMLIGVDIDKAVISSVHKSALQMPFSKKVKLIHGDAWNLPFSGELDIISSCGLNFYERNREKKIQLYQQFFNALKGEGILIISFLTYPPWKSKQSEWRQDIPAQYTNLEQIIFDDILDLKCRNFSSSDEFHEELKEAGFNGIEFYYDTYHIFPTVTACKSL